MCVNVQEDAQLDAKRNDPPETLYMCVCKLFRSIRVTEAELKESSTDLTSQAGSFIESDCHDQRLHTTQDVQTLNIEQY